MVGVTHEARNAHSSVRLVSTSDTKALYCLWYSLAMVTGPDPGRCNRCKCIGQKKVADACIGQICTTNNYKHHSLRSARIKCVYAITHVLEFVRCILIIITNYAH